MCGIAVALDLLGRGRAEPWALPLMRHRGPDAEGEYLQDGNLVLEHCRLAIIDPENQAAGQPFIDASGRWVMVYNGEVFNFRALRAELEREGVAFRTHSDTEVVLEAFVRYGESALARFKGMFAFVVWNRETGEVFAARDQLGVKPLYYTVSNGMFVAASELRTVMKHPSVTAELSPENVVEYLAFGCVAGDRTLLEGIHKLLPGHALWLRKGQVDVFEYWDILSPTREPTPTERLEDELLDRLDDSVSSALVSDVPVGLMLSGGLDSSTIAALAVRHVEPRDLTAYSIDFGLPNDESAVAARFARELGIRHQAIQIREEDLRDQFDPWLDTVDAPSGNPTWIAVTQIARLARADGIKVLLSGDGGDELFGGYSRWMTYLRFHDRIWSRAPGRLKEVVGRAARPFARGLAGDISRRAMDGGELFVGSRPFHDDDLNHCLGPVGRDALIVAPPERHIEALRERFDARYGASDYLAWMSYVSFKTDLVEDYLARLDKMGMQESVEGRVPLLDPRLVRWSFPIPQAQKVPSFAQKALFRRSVQRLLPEYITQRPKQGFCPPVAEWAQSLLLDRLDGAGILVDEGLIAPGAVDRLRRGPSVGSSFALWTLGTLSTWAELNL